MNLVAQTVVAVQQDCAFGLAVPLRGWCIWASLTNDSAVASAIHLLVTFTNFSLLEQVPATVVGGAVVCGALGVELLGQAPAFSKVTHLASGYLQVKIIQLRNGAFAACPKLWLAKLVVVVLEQVSCVVVVLLFQLGLDIVHPGITVQVLVVFLDARAVNVAEVILVCG